MKAARLALLAALGLAPAFAQAPQNYAYEYPSLLNPYNSSLWTSNGTSTPSNNMYTSSATNGGSLILNQGIAAPSNCYEVRFTLNLNGSGGNYFVYLRASSNAQFGSTATGTFYAVEITNPTLANGSYTATLNYWKVVNGTVTHLGNDPVYPNAGATVFRIVMIQGNGIEVYQNNLFWNSYYDTSSPIPSGQPGVGVNSAPSGNGITAIDIGQLDTTPPYTVNTQLVGTSAWPNYVDIQFPDVLDQNGTPPPGATGIAYYQFFRNGSWLTLTGTPNLEDRSVQPSTAYTYEIMACDFHANCSAANINVTTPPAGSIDPREVGVRPTGSYWGGAGEQIDLRSGNLNFTIPLLNVMSRGGKSYGFNLSYNSENWRQDPGGTWQLGRDIGYGYGWKLQAGSITPIYDGIWELDHYEFIDSTGAQYRLDQNNNGVWSSKESIYVYYDSNAQRLYFRDGSFWTFGCTSAGTEQDSGTMYPMSLFDSNGNWVSITYEPGVGLSTINTSSRIYAIEDVRGNGAADYSFTYNHDAIPHLTGITNSIGTAENYSLSYNTMTLCDAFTCTATYGTWSFLGTLTTTGVNTSTNFQYWTNNNGAGNGELTQVTFPYGGHIRWAAGTFTYDGNVSQPEVNSRYLSMSAGAPEGYYEIGYSPYTNAFFHVYCVVDDADGLGEKSWTFSSTSGPGYGLMSSLESRPKHWYYPQVAGSLHDDYTWTTDSLGNQYISTDLTTEDDYDPTAIQKKTTQTLDQYSNLTQMQVYNYGNLSTPARTYTNTYQNTSAYTSLYILNRLLTSTVTDGTNTTTLATNSYDQYTLTNVTGMNEHYSGYNTSWTTRGNVTTSVTPAGTTTLGYDIGGNLLTNNNNGLTTSSTVSSTTNYTAPSAVTTISLSSSLNYSAALGVTSATGPNGDNLGIVYDATNRPHTTTAPTGAVTTYTYNDTASPPNKIATTNGHWVRTNMDGFGRTVSTLTGYGTTTLSEVDAVYVFCGCSPIGKMGSQSAPYTPPGTGYLTTYSYDGRGRTVYSELPDGSITHYSYAANTVTATDPAGKTKTFTIDAFGNLTQVQEPDPALGTVSTNYTYDILNHLTQVSMPRGSNTQTRTFKYNVGTTVGVVLLSATNPENGTVTYTYNSDSTLHTKTDAKSQVFTYSYDSYKRLTQIQVGSTVLRTFMYDTNTLDSNFSGSYTAGRLVAVQNAAFTPNGYGGGNISTPSTMQLVEMYAYTQAGLTSGKRLQVQETLYTTLNGVGQYTPRTLNMDTAYTYDTGGEGKVLSVNYPSTYSWNGTQLVPASGPAYTYSFDAMYRPTGLTDQNNNTVVNNVSYNAANQLSTFNTETRTYNNLNQMTQLTITGSQPLNISYNFTAGANNGKITSQTDNISAETVTYQYDSLNRLLSASSSQSWSETYGFDAFGNLLSKTPTGGAPALSQSVYPASNQIMEQTYDSNGNQISSSLGSLTYDAENRVATGPGGVQYAYDSRNKRIWRGTLSGGTLAQQVYVYGVDGQKIGTYTFTLGQYGETNTPEMTNSTVLLATFFGRKRIGTFDRLGSAKYNQNNAAQSFYPYGEDRGTMEPNDSLKFATYTRDTATGLDYADQRYYASNFGRFTSVDRYRASKSGTNNPKSPKSWNRYTYALSDPINRFDPSGRYACDPDDQDCPTDECDPGDECWPGTQPAQCTVGVDGDAFTGPGGTGQLPRGCSAEGGEYHPPRILPSCEQQLSSGIDQWLAGTPLAGLGPEFVGAAFNAGLNPILLVAIAFAESQLGETAPSGTNNAFGLMHKTSNGYGLNHYVTFALGIPDAARTVDSQFTRGNVTVAQIYSGQPGAYCVNQPGFPCSNGYANVASEFVNISDSIGIALGIDDPNNSFDLLWPCYSPLLNPTGL